MLRGVCKLTLTTRSSWAPLIYDTSDLGLQALLPFLCCESFPAALARAEIETECLRLAARGLIDYCTPLALLRDAQQIFHDAFETQWGDRPIEECWIVQESHAGQRRPVLTSHSGTPILYKPRSLNIEAGWHAVLSWYESALGECISEKFKVASSGKSGWCEVVRPSQVATFADVNRYYRQLGLLAAITWTLGSADLTGSNIVAAKAGPTVVDAEMILVPGNCIFGKDLRSEFRQLGLLPFTAQDSNGVSITFGAAALCVPTCKHVRTHQGGNSACAFCHHIPYLEGQPCFVDKHGDAMCKGFAHGLRVLQSLAPQLATRCSPLDNLEGAKGRITMRPSAVYELLKQKMLSSGEQAEMSSIQKLLRKLPTKHPISRNRENELIVEELLNLIRGDLPRFEISVSDHALRIGDAQVVCFRYSALERARERLRGLTGAGVVHATQIFTTQVKGAIASAALQIKRR